MDEKERKEQEREDFRKTGGMVTRIEFYTCFMVLFALILWRGGLVNQNLEMRMWNAEKNTIHEIDALWNDVNREIEAIPEKIREERDSPFWNPGMEIAGVNRKAGTFRLAIQATPKEYREGMEGAFYVTCDDGERIVLQGLFDESRILRAETELPICGKVSATAILKENGTTRIQVLNDLNDVEEEITPGFSAFSGFSIQYDKEGADITAHDIEVSVYCSDHLRHSRFLPGEGELEIQTDGRTVGTVPLKKAMRNDGEEWRYWDEKEGKAVRVEYGQRISLVFRMQDNSGAVYRYLVEESIMTDEGPKIVEEGPKTVEFGSPEQDGSSRLTIE